MKYFVYLYTVGYTDIAVNALIALRDFRIRKVYERKIIWLYGKW